MKRNAIALLLQPYKNRLIPRPFFKESIDRFVRNLLAIFDEFPHLRINLVLPAYMLECINPILLSQLREVQKKGNLEWLLTGYTEPFLSLSPPLLTIDNIQHGIQIFTELTGTAPAGFLPPFSNYEPSLIELIKNNGLSYIVVSNDLLSDPLKKLCGYWMAEHSGSSIPLIATNTVRTATAPADLKNWIEKIYSSDIIDNTAEKVTTIHYQFSLKEEGESDPFRWLKYAASEIDKHILNFQPITISELIRSYQPLGLQYIPSSLLMGTKNQVDLHFLNYLHSFDQIGILQRKLMDIFNSIINLKDARTVTALKHRLFFVQDINRLLPGKEAGFENASDRLWTYGRLIDIEKELHKISNIVGGQIRISDFLRNGNKSVILSNKSIKLYIDHHCGGTIFEFDYRDRLINLCAAYTPQPHQMPDILVAGKSKTWFLDRILPENARGSDFLNNQSKDIGNFVKGQFTYKVSKNNTGIRVVLNRPGAILQGDKYCPLSMEKVFGLEKDTTSLSFVYQLTNQSLTTYAFKFTTEMSFSFPGLFTGDVHFVSGDIVFDKIGLDYYQIESITKWYIEDKLAGLRLMFQTQKPVDIWCLPSNSVDGNVDVSNGITLIISSSVSIEPSSQWKLLGKLTCRRLRKKVEDIDAI